MTNAERDKDMIESIEMWLHEIEPKWVEKELAWLDELRTRLLEEKSGKTMNQEGLLEEVNRYYSDNFEYISSDQPTLSILTNVARHFAQWGADHTPLPEDTVLFNKGVEEGKRLMMEEGNVILTEEDFEAEKEKSMEWGYNLCKEQIMKEAEEYEVGMHGEPIKITLDKYVQRAKGIFPGDKVRIIIVKE